MIKVVVGTEKKTRNMSEHEKKLTAYHEAGHAIITRLLPSQDPRSSGFHHSARKSGRFHNEPSERG